MNEQLIRLFKDSRQPGTCRGCGAAIDWYKTATGKRMPMNANALPRTVDTDPVTRGLIGSYAAADSHWSSCPDAAAFKRKAK